MIPSSYEHYNKLDYLFYSLYNNQTIQTHRTNSYSFYATRFTPDDDATSYSAKYGTYFDLRLISSSANPPISHQEYFRLSKRKHEATILLLKPLPGPQVIKLELTIIGYKKQGFYRQKVQFTINVAEFSSM